MAYICTKPPHSCDSCEHYRFDDDKQRNCCFAEMDNFANGAPYELAFYKQVDNYKKCDALGLAIRAKNGYSDDFGLPEYQLITVNLPGPFSNEPELIGIKNAAYLDINNCARLIEELKKLKFNGEPVMKDTGFTRRSGFVTYPLYQFNEEWLRSLPLAYLACGSYDQYAEQYK